MTGEELTARQAWTLNQKIDHSVGTIEAFISRTGKIPYVAFSGGKDSTVLLDLCRRFVKSDIKGVFVNTGNEYPEIVKFVRTVDNVVVISPACKVSDVLANYGFPLVSKETALKIRQVKNTQSEKLIKIRMVGTGKGTFGVIPEKWKFLIKAPFDVSEKCCYILKKRPSREYERNTGEVPVIGTMAAESRARRTLYLRRNGCNVFEGKHCASYPLSIWTEADIWQYIKRYNIPICELYRDKQCQRTGCMFCGFGAHLDKGKRFEMLYRLHPALYRKMMAYKNNDVTYRQALRAIGVPLPDEVRQLYLFDEKEIDGEC